MLNDLKQNSLPSHSRVPPVGVRSLRKYPGMSRIPRHSSAPPTAVRKKLLMAPHLLQGLCHSSNCIPKEWGYHIPEEHAGYTQQLPRAGNNTGGTRARGRNIPVEVCSKDPSSQAPQFRNFWEKGHTSFGEGTHCLWRLQDNKKSSTEKINHGIMERFLSRKRPPRPSHSDPCAMGRDT